MESGPIPPYERPWRHPSEIAAANRHEIRSERPSGFVRAAALLGGTTTALLMGVLVLSLTPERVHGPTVAGSVPIQGSDALQSAPRIPEPPLATVLASDGTAVAPSGAVLAGMARPSRVVDEVMTASSGGVILQRISRDRPTAGPVTPQVEVALADGSRTIARVIDPGDGTGLALIKLHHPADPARPLPEPHRASPDQPAADTVVTVLAAGAVPIRLVELLDSLPAGGAVPDDELPYPDGTPVVDGEGLLIGVLASNDDGMTLVSVIPTDDAATTPTTPDP